MTTNSSDFTKSIVLITGSSRGIGNAVAKKLSKKNCFIIATCTNQKDIPQLEEELCITSEDGIKQGFVITLNVRNEEQIQNVSKIILERCGRLDYLINCAGIMEREQCKIEDESSDMWDEVLDTNLKGTFLMCKYMIPLLKFSNNAHIVNISGGLGLFSSGMEGGTLPAYRISKAGVNALSLILAEELKENKIMVNSVDPGWVRTDLGGQDAPKSPEEAANEIIQVLEVPFDLKRTGALLKEGKVISY